VTAVAVGELDGRAIAVSAGDDATLRVWTLHSARLVGQAFHWFLVEPALEEIRSSRRPRHTCRAGPFVEHVASGAEPEREQLLRPVRELWDRHPDLDLDLARTPR
jgi:hypothetical protein